MFGRDSADRLTNIRNKGGDNLLCEEYIAAKILVRCFGIYALNTDSFGKRSAFGTSLSGQALLKEINSDTLQYNELCGNDDGDAKFDLDGFMETEDSLPEGIMKRYEFLKNQLCEETFSIPLSQRSMTSFRTKSKRSACSLPLLKIIWNFWESVLSSLKKSCVSTVS